MATRIEVSKLISTFGFEVDEKSRKRAESVVEDFKKKLKTIHARVILSAQSNELRQVKRTAKKQAEILQDAHVKVLRQKEKGDREFEARRRKLAKDSTEKTVKEVVRTRSKAIKGAVRRSSGGAADINRLLGVDRPRQLGDLREFYRSQEKTSALRDAFRENRALEQRNRILQKQQQIQERMNQKRLAMEQRIASARQRSGGGGGGFSRGLRNFAGGIAPQLAAGGAAVGSAFAVRALFQGTQELDSFESAMTAVLGTSEKAKDELKFFVETAKKLNAPLLTGMKSYKAFVAAAVGSGIELEKARDTYEALAKFSRVVGISADDSSGALRALSQVASKGQLYREELQQQLAERLPGITSLVAKGLGKTTAELDKMMQAGEVSAKMAFDAIIKSLTELSDPVLDEVVHNLSGTWQEFINVFQEVVFILREFGSSDTMKNIIINLTDFARGFMPFVNAALLTFGKILEIVTGILGTESGGAIAAIFLFSFAIKKLFFGAFGLLKGIAVLRTFAASVILVGATSGGAAAGVAVLTTGVRALGLALLSVMRYVAPLLLIADIIEGLFTDRLSFFEEMTGLRLGSKGVQRPETIAQMFGKEDQVAGLLPDFISDGFKSLSNSFRNTFNIEINASGNDAAAIGEATKHAIEQVNANFTQQLNQTTMSTPGGFN